jgi:hypothetical protein
LIDAQPNKRHANKGLRLISASGVGKHNSYLSTASDCPRPICFTPPRPPAAPPSALTFDRPKQSYNARRALANGPVASQKSQHATVLVAASVHDVNNRLKKIQEQLAPGTVVENGGSGV